MRYRQVLDEAIGTAPLSTVDVNRIVIRVRRRVALQRTVATASALVIVVFTGLVVVNNLPATARVSDVGAPTGPTETRAQAKKRLDAAVVADAAHTAHGLTWHEETGFPNGWGSTWGTANEGFYYAGRGLITVGGLTGALTVNIGRRMLNGCGSNDQPPCAQVYEADGTVTSFGPLLIGKQDCPTVANAAAIPTELENCAKLAGPAGAQISEWYLGADSDTIYVYVARPDGVLVQIDVNNKSGLNENDPSTEKAPPLTAVQLIDIGLDPELTFAAGLR